jgi:hypothetical protein
MQQSEDRYQDAYARILRVDPSTMSGGEQIVPLPINAEVSEMSEDQETFEQNRARTIALLETAGDGWTQELLDLVRRQVADDRRHTTALAECRKVYFAGDTRPDLAEPLTQSDDVVREPTPSPESVRLETTSQ